MNHAPDRHDLEQGLTAVSSADPGDHAGLLIELTSECVGAPPAHSQVEVPPAIERVESLSQLCNRVALEARREVAGLATQRFFTYVAEALDRPTPAALALELAPHVRDAWVRDNIDRGLDLFTACPDESGRRCVATLVAEYLGWREAPDAFFHRVAELLLRRRQNELDRLARILTAYARLPRPAIDEQRLLAAVPGTAPQRRPAAIPVLCVLGFLGEPAVEWVRSPTEIPCLGADPLFHSLAAAEFGWLAEPGPISVPLVGRPLLWFPPQLDAELRRLHMLLTAGTH